MRNLLLTLSLLLLPVSPVLAEEIGKVIAARGDTHAVDAQGVKRVLKRRSLVLDGDTLFTGDDARLQVRFADGTLLALHPASEYRIDRYQFDEAGDDENFSTLLKGGFRTITGVISKKDPAAYQVETPVATIGVRGTNYETALTDKGLDVAAWEGGVKVSTRAGELFIGAGEDFNFASVGAPDARPRGLLKPPSGMGGPLIEADTPEPAEGSVVGDETGGEETSGEMPSAPPTETGAGAEGTTDGDGGNVIADVGFDAGVDAVLKTDATFTPIEPLDNIGTLAERLAEADKRLDPREWQKLLADGYGGFLVFGGQGPDHITGGRALAPSGTMDPVFTQSHLEPFDPAFETAGVDVVYRRGMASLDGAGVVPIGGENIYWGIWNGTSTPVDKLTDPRDPNVVKAIHRPVFWTVARPVDPMRNDIATFNNVVMLHGGGSLGQIAPGDVTQLSMKINFATGAVTNGVFDVNKSPDNWNVLFNGTINGPFVHLDIKNTSRINGLYPIIGDMGGFMAGKNGKALVGGFDLEQDGDPSNHIEGIFILQE